MREINLTVVDAASETAGWAIMQYIDELNTRFENPSFDVAAALENAREAYNPPNGLFITASIDDEIVGCGAYQTFEDSVAEIKRMWVQPDARGLGIAKRMLAFLEGEAAKAGFTKVVLDTASPLREAIGLYRSQGYIEVERYNDNPKADHFFAKHLTDKPSKIGQF